MNPSPVRIVVAVGQCPPQPAAISSPPPRQQPSSALPAPPPDPTRRAARQAIRQRERETLWRGSPQTAVLPESAKIAELRTRSERQTRPSATHSRALRGVRREPVPQGLVWRRADARVNREPRAAR